MFRTGSSIGLVLFTFAPACAQWSIGPQVELARFQHTGWHTVGGAGAGVVRGLTTRTWLTGTASWHPAQVVNGHYQAGNPRQLATGDTASASVRSMDRYGFFSAAIGARYSFTRRARKLRWVGGMAVSYGADRIRHQGDATYTYTGEHVQWNDVRRYPFLLARIGGECLLHVRRMDLDMGLWDTWAWPIGDVKWTDRTFFHHSLALTLTSEWRL